MTNAVQSVLGVRSAFVISVAYSLYNQLVLVALFPVAWVYTNKSI